MSYISLYAVLPTVVPTILAVKLGGQVNVFLFYSVQFYLFYSFLFYSLSWRLTQAAKKANLSPIGWLKTLNCWCSYSLSNSHTLYLGGDMSQKFPALNWPFPAMCEYEHTRAYHKFSHRVWEPLSRDARGERQLSSCCCWWGGGGGGFRICGGGGGEKGTVARN